MGYVVRCDSKFLYTKITGGTKIVESFKDDRVIVEKAKQAVKCAELDIQLAEIIKCYASLLPHIKQLRSGPSRPHI